MHQQGIALPDDAFKDKLSGEGGHAKLWAIVERVEADLQAAETGFQDTMLTEQEHFTETLTSLSNQVDKLSSFVDMEKVRLGFILCACPRMYKGTAG